MSHQNTKNAIFISFSTSTLLVTTWVVIAFAQLSFAQVPVDADISQITSPAPLALGDNTVAVEISNQGFNSLNGMPMTLQYYVDGGGWTTDVFVPTALGSTGSTEVFAFTPPWAVASAGSYDLCVRINPQVAGDPDPFDELCMAISTGLDFGDAPDPTYPTLLANDGARHFPNGPFLGASVDADPDGQPNITATGDDLTGADEDGVAFTSQVIPQSTASIDVTVSTAGLLDAWIDWNQDGDWMDSGEQVFLSESLSAGVNALNITVPVDALEGSTFARFRVSSAGGLSPTGEAPDGEVEDYLVTVSPLAAVAVPTLGGWSLFIFIAALAGAGMLRQSRL